MKPRSGNLALIAIVAEGFLSRLSFGMLSFALPLYAYHLGMHLTEIGILASINLVVAMALKPAMGVLADRVGLKPSFTAATALRSVVSLALAFVSSPWQLLTVRSVYGISQSLRDPALNALLAEHGGQKRIAAAFGWYSTAKSVGGSLGSALAGILLGLTASNYSLVFVAAFVLSILPVFIVGRYVQERSATSESADDRLELVRAVPGTWDAGNSSRASASSLVILSYIGLGTLISGTAQMLRGLLPILATQYAGLSETETGVVYTASTLVVMFSGPLFGWLSDNVSQKLVLMVRGIANTLSSILFVALPNLAGITLGKVVDDVGKAAFKPAWGALMADVSSFEKKRRTQIISLMCLAEDAGEIGGPILAGLLWSAWGVPVVLGVRILLAVITEVYATVLIASMNTRRRFECLPPIGASRAAGP
ncbi:MAG: MFS transporter [Acidobacteria bacterium]|nr:MAG: MFS transporter [Acidobacteriota bacterium]